MILIECEQGTPEWLAARCAAITASCFEEAISVMQKTSGKRKPGDPTAASDKYAFEVAIERVSGVPYGAPVKAWTLDRGHELEWQARAGYEELTGGLAFESGVVLSDDRKFGYSTDGLVGTDGLIEIKCPVDTVKIMSMLTTGDVSEYEAQMQGGMWLTGRAYCDFIQFVPALESVGKHLFVKRVLRDDEFIDAMVKRLLAFEHRVSETEDFLRRKAA